MWNNYYFLINTNGKIVSPSIRWFLFCHFLLLCKLVSRPIISINFRDWQGLAELVGIPGHRIPNMKDEFKEKVTEKILEIWYENNKNGSTISLLLQNLEHMERFDIYDDIIELIG